MNINNINIKVSDRKQKEILNKAEDLVDNVSLNHFSRVKVSKIIRFSNLHRFLSIANTTCLTLLAYV